MKSVARRSTVLWSAVTLILLLLSAGPLLAITDEEIFRDFRFNLSNPGARSLGLGGAFIAVADDATAALANPAGLMLLTRPEFFTEMRVTQVDDSTFSGPVRLEVIDPNNPMHVGSLTTDTAPRSVFSPSFFSYVFPWGRFAAGISRVEVNKSSNLTRNLFTLDFDPNNVGGELPFIGNGRIEADLSVWNLSGAYKINDKLSVGATVALGTLNLKSGVTNSFVDDPNSPIFLDPNAFYPLPSATILLYETGIDDSDTDVSFNLGVHWRPHPKLSVGAVYRGGLQFELDEEVFNDQAMAHPYMFGFALSDPNVVGTPFTTSFNTPDSYGVGVTYRPVNALTLSVDWIHIEYEDLLDGFQPGLNVLNLVGFALPTNPNDPGCFFCPVATRAEDFPFTIDNADEFHFGAEYVFTAGTVPWAVRGGCFTDHNSRLFADFDTRRAQPFFADNNSFQERDTEIHYTIGTGVVVKERFQIDAAADISGITNEYVLSTIFRF